VTAGVIFAAYAVGVVASLSDWVGRRRMILLAVGTNMLSGLLFLLWPTTAGLIVARVGSGVSIGMLTAAVRDSPDCSSGATSA
jgi:MFS family permease